MNQADFSSMKLTELREFAAIAGVTLPVGARKAEIVAFLTQQQEAAMRQESAPPAEPPVQEAEEESAEEEKINPAAGELLSSGECGDCCGVLDVLNEGYGFLRCGPFSFAKKGMQRDVYVSIAQIHRFKLRTGDKIAGKTRPLRSGEKYAALLYVSSVNDLPPDTAAKRRRFETLVPVFPNQRLTLEGASGDVSVRLVDLIAPIGKGQRSMIVAQPKSGKTVLLKKIARAIEENYPQVELMVLLIDERPEEVTDMARSIKSDVLFSTFDEMPDNHVRVAELVLERAQRLVEHGKDVVILLDSITRLARAYNMTITPTGKTLSGGLDPGALYKPKKFFGAARCMEGGGSLTILATALVETGSRMDDIIYEEFKGTGNSELHLDRHLAEKRIYPAIDVNRSGTRREELLLSAEELDAVWKVRKMLADRGNEQAAEQWISMLSHAKTNAEFVKNVLGHAGKR